MSNLTLSEKWGTYIVVKDHPSQICKSLYREQKSNVK